MVCFEKTQRITVMLKDKANAICLLHVLQEYSDAEHIIPMREIISKMLAQYGISIDRRTVYSAIALLRELGYDISDYEENGRGYYLATRALEPSEARLLMDSVLRSAFIPAKYTSDLIGKIQSLLSAHQRKRYKHLIVAKPLVKGVNKDIFLNADIIEEAIDKKCKVSFTYLTYDFDKKLKPRRERKYLVNPYAMVCANEQYYLVCNYDAHDKISHYRIDRIKDIEIIEERIKPPPKEFNAQAYTDQAIYMFGGKAEVVTLKCSNSILDYVIDKFGTGVKIKKSDDETFCATFKAAPYGVKFWALQYLPFCEVLEPKWLREEIAASIKSHNYWG